MFVRNLFPPFRHALWFMADELDAALDAAGSAATERIVDSGEPGTAPEAPEAPAAPGERDGAPDPAPERPGRPASEYERELRAENASYREKWKPFEDAFGSLDDESRAALLESGGTIGADLAYLARAATNVHPDDRRIIASVMANMRDDPAGAAEDLSTIADQLRGGPPAPEAPTFAEGDDDEFISRGEVRAFMEESNREQAEAAELRENTGIVRAEARELGYDLDSNDPLEAARVNTLFEIAKRSPDGDLRASVQWANKVLTEQWEQQVIDRYGERKRKDADRPSTPGGAGSAPSEERVLETMEDADAAMSARLDEAGFRGRQR